MTRGQSLLWAAAGLGLAAIAAFGLVWQPVPTGLALAAALFIGATALWPKVAAAAVFLAVLSARELPIVTHVQALSYLDEGAVVAAVLVFCGRRLMRDERLRGIPGGRWFLAWIALGAASSLVGHVPASLWVFSGFLSIKGVLFAFAVAQIDWTADDMRRIAHFGGWLLLGALVCSVVQTGIPDWWAAHFATGGQVDRRSGPLPSLIGPFAHPSEFGLIASCATIAALAWRTTVGRSLSNTVLGWGALVGAALTFRRKSIIGLLLSVLVVATKTHLRRTLLIVAFATPAVLVLAWPVLMDVVHFTAAEYLTSPDSTARIVLTRDSFAVAWEHFPFGAGFGRFGSYLAGVHYSPEYLSRGYPAIWGLGDAPGNGNALTDTQWPAAIGETGLLGGAVLAVAFVLVYRRGRDVFARSPESAARWIGLVCMGWSVQFVIESTASAVYNSPPLYPLLFGVVGLVAALPVRSDAAAHPGDVVGAGHRLEAQRGRGRGEATARGERAGIALAGAREVEVDRRADVGPADRR